MAGPAPRVFVSHSHKDDEFTGWLVTDLKAAGADVWVDVVRVDSGDFLERINAALASREWLVLVLTPDAVQSGWVRKEVNAALNLVEHGYMRQVIPVLAKSVNQRDIPPLWSTLHRYDATRDYQAALAGLLWALGLVAPAAPGRQSAPPPPPLAPPSMPADRFPPRLVELGYQGLVLSGAEVILPPLCAVSAGAFLMGSDPARDKETQNDEEPQHWVTLPDVAIARFPVTVAEYTCFVRSGHAEPKSPYNQLTWQQQRERPNHPVVNVSWHDAVGYAAFLAKQPGQPWRLPSEAEWEKAARWDAATRTSRIYPWGNQWDQTRCNTSAGDVKATTPVGIYPNGASPCGAQEMVGNVWEWTSSLYEPYPYSVSDGRENLNSTENRVLRGGSSVYIAWYARAACRGNFLPGGAFFNLGLRLARAVPS